jgi:hypothetical protein
MARHGANWDAVGAYNAACTRLQPTDCAAARSRYAWQVYRQLPVRGIDEAASMSVSTPLSMPVPVPVPASASVPVPASISAQFSVDHDAKPTGACPAFTIARVTP